MPEKNLNIENPDNSGVRIRCRCGEYLYPADLETFCLCPYCGSRIENGPALEDFVIDPLIRQWTERNKNS